MLGYATIGTNDLRRAQAFYDALLAEVGASRSTPAQRWTRFTKRHWSSAARMRERPGFEARKG
jgi:hypothetical protein